MICKVCGRTITNEEANFCEYCGTSFRPGTDNKISEEEAFHNNGPMNQSGAGYTQFNRYDQATVDSMNGTPFQQNAMPGQNEQNSKQVPPMGFGILSGSDRPMTFGNWLFIYLLPFIPFVGQIFFLVLLLSWGFGANTAPTKKNWARATMVMILFLLVMFAALVSGGYFGDPAEFLNSFMQMPK